MVVTGIECGKHRVIWAPNKTKTEDVELWKESVGHSCGRTNNPNRHNFYVNQKLTCDSPIEAAYYKLGPDVCYQCGDLIDDAGIIAEADDLFKIWNNVRPSCKKPECGDHKATHRRRGKFKATMKRKGKFYNPNPKKKRKTDPVDVLGVTAAVNAIGAITEEWLGVMRDYWNQLRRN